MSKRVLIIDDEPYVLRLGSRILGEAGYEVQVAVNGEAGLELAKTFRPHLVITDIMLPGIDGFTVCSRLKGDPELSQVPVVILSSRQESNDFQRALKAGAADQMVKPFSPSALVRCVGRVLGDPEPPPSAPRR